METKEIYHTLFSEHCLNLEEVIFKLMTVLLQCTEHS
jgi:hypothetical protein